MQRIMLLVCKEIVGIKYIGIRFNRKENFSFTANPCTHVRYAKGAVIQAAINNK